MSLREENTNAVLPDAIEPHLAGLLWRGLLIMILSVISGSIFGPLSTHFSVVTRGLDSVLGGATGFCCAPVAVGAWIRRPIWLCWGIAFAVTAGITFLAGYLDNLLVVYAISVGAYLASICATDYFVPKLKVPTTNQCRKCGYDLRGLPTPRCPECGFENQAVVAPPPGGARTDIQD